MQLQPEAGLREQKRRRVSSVKWRSLDIVRIWKGDERVVTEGLQTTGLLLSAAVVLVPVGSVPVVINKGSKLTSV